LGEDDAFPGVFLADVVGEFDCGEAAGEGPEEASGVDFGELVVVTDEDRGRRTRPSEVTVPFRF